jgi:hypothetical protein
MYEVEDIGTIIENAGLGTVGTDIFLYSAPADPSAMPFTIVYPSNDPPIIDPERPYYLRGKFQTIVRANDYQSGLLLAKALSDALTFFNQETPLMKIKECRPLYQVRVYRRSDSGAIEFSVTYKITYVQK